MKILVTGASGFIGRRLLDSFSHTAHQVETLSTRNKHIDVQDRDHVMQRLHATLPQVVIHLAGVSGPMVAADSPEVVARSNCVGAANVFECSRLAGVERVIYASSISGYDRGTPERPRPGTVYGASKRFGEMLLDIYRSGRLNGINAVLGSVYGPSRVTRDVLDDMVDEALHHGRIRFDPNGLLPLVHVDDAADCLVALSTLQPPPSSFDVVSEILTEHETAQMIAEAVGVPRAHLHATRSGGSTYPGSPAVKRLRELLSPGGYRKLADTLPSLIRSPRQAGPLARTQTERHNTGR